MALAAPTGKAATRMKEAVEEAVADLVSSGRLRAPLADALLAIEPTTIHRLLGRRTRTAFRHDRSIRCPMTSSSSTRLRWSRFPC